MQINLQNTFICAAAATACSATMLGVAFAGDLTTIDTPVLRDISDIASRFIAYSATLYGVSSVITGVSGITLALTGSTRAPHSSADYPLVLARA